MTLSCPSMPRGCPPCPRLAPRWELSRHIYQTGFCWGFAPWTASGPAGRTQREHITGSSKEGSILFCIFGCQISSPSVWSLTPTEQFLQWNHLWSKQESLKICPVTTCYTDALCTPLHPSTSLNCSGEEMPGDMTTKYSTIEFIFFLIK